MKTYEGERDKDGTCHVYIVERFRRRPLPLRLDLANKSPTGFEWGYMGSGPAQLALAILADVKGDEYAKTWFQGFKVRAIGNLKRDEPWTLSENQVREVMAVLEKEAEEGPQP